MELDPTLFASPMFETANEAVLFALTALENEGQVDLTASLNGLPPVNEAVIGRVVFQRLSTLRHCVSGTSQHYIDIALNALGRALAQPELRAVA